MCQVDCRISAQNLSSRAAQWDGYMTGKYKGMTVDLITL